MKKEKKQRNYYQEINNALKMLVDVAVEEDKPVVADLKEDTSYLLFLANKKLGYLEQIGDDIQYPFKSGLFPAAGKYAISGAPKDHASETTYYLYVTDGEDFLT